MSKWNIPTDRVERVGEKNGVICLVIMLLPEIWSLKCQKFIFLVFSADDSEILVTVWEKY